MIRHIAKKGGKLQLKLTSMVLKIVLGAFLLIFAIATFISYQSYQRLEISNQRSQLDKTAAQVASLQTTTANMARQVLYDEVIERAIRGEEVSVGTYLYNIRNAHNTLSKYMHILEGIQEILIYNDDGITFSSQDVRDPFDPDSESNDWYREFMESGRTEGFSGIHNSEPANNNIRKKVVSYILSYFSSEFSGAKSGKVLVNIELSRLEEIVRFGEDMITGYCLYGSDHKPLVSGNTIDLSYEELQERLKEEADQNLLRLRSGNVLLISRDMQDGWLLALEISGAALLKRSVASFLYLLIIFLLIVIVLMIALRTSIDHIVKPINQLSEAAAAVGEGDFTVSVDISTHDEVEMLADVFNKMVVNIRTLMHESVEHEKVRRRMQIENLLLQINPHFIYNTMNSIVYMARMNGNPQIADFANAFISLLQGTLREEDSVYNTVRGELETAKNYLYLQQYRYPDKFTYEIDCPEELLDCQILNVMLQPVVENAIFHGLAPKETSGVLKISVQNQKKTDSLHTKDILCIRVEDDGVGMSPETLAKQTAPGQRKKHRGIHGIGVANVRERISQIYGEDYGLEIESEEGVGTCVTMTVPYEKASQDGITGCASKVINSGTF